MLHLRVAQFIVQPQPNRSTTGLKPVPDAQSSGRHDERRLHMSQLAVLTVGETMQAALA